MRKALLWLGGLLAGVGLALIAANVVMSFMGLSASYNIGDPTKFEFILVPLWPVGVAAVVVGAGCLLGARRLREVPR